jgi:hypothetical protein
MADKIRKEIESKEALDAHMRQHCEEQNCIQQCCQNYLSQIADFSKRQVESAIPVPFFNSNLPNQPGDHFHGHFHPQHQQQHGHFHGHFGHFHHGNNGHNHHGN